MTSNSTASPITEIIHYRHLLWTLTWRDLRVRYKQSVLGFSWAILLPLLMTAIFAFVFSRSITLQANDARLPYALYALAGLAPWTFFSSSLSNCVNVLVANRNLITKVYFPREVFPLSCILSALVDFLIACTALAGLIAFYHLTGRWSFAPSLTLLYLPLLLTVQVALTIGVGLLLSMANLFYRDVRHVFGVGIQLLMFVSAVVIPSPGGESLLAAFFRLNPLVPLFESYRACLLHGAAPEPDKLIQASCTAIMLLVLGWFAFHRASDRFAEYV